MDGTKYKGEVRGTQRDGNGCITWPDGDQFEGSFFMDQPKYGKLYVLKKTFALVDDEELKMFSRGDEIEVIGESIRHRRCLCMFSGSPRWIPCKDIATRFDTVR
jgi:hypothetical protein